MRLHTDLIRTVSGSAALLTRSKARVHVLRREES